MNNRKKIITILFYLIIATLMVFFLIVPYPRRMTVKIVLEAVLFLILVVSMIRQIKHK